MKITEKEKAAVWIYLQSYATYKPFSPQEWFDASDMVHASPKLQAYIKKLVK